MYLNCQVAIPDAPEKIVQRKTEKAVYIYYEYGRDYDTEKNMPRKPHYDRQAVRIRHIYDVVEPELQEVFS